MTKARDQQLALARTRLAEIAIERSSPDEALALLVSALNADRSHSQAVEMARNILAETRWNFPETTLTHPHPVESVYFPDGDSLWAGVAGTLVRWDMNDLAVRATMFPVPVPDATIRSLAADESSTTLLVERAGVPLLMDAATLKPLASLDPLPEFVTPAAVVAFSPDGLLVAHPTVTETGSLVWQLRDSRSGGIIRSHEANPRDPLPLAAILNRRELRVLHADGSLLEIPISPLEEIRRTPHPDSPELLHGAFAADGGSALVLRKLGPHLPPVRETLALGGAAHSSLEPDRLLEKHPWNRHPSLWTGLLEDPVHPLLWVEENRLDLLVGKLAPLHTKSPITAVAVRGQQVAIGTEDGSVVLSRLLAPPTKRNTDAAVAAVDGKSIEAFSALTEFVAGFRIGDDGIKLSAIPDEERLESFRKCKFDDLAGLFPDLDFTPLIASAEALRPRANAPDGISPFSERIARARPVSSPGHSGSTAKELEKALASEDPQLIEEALKGVGEMPQLLKRLAMSRIAWLQNRKADAMTLWPDGFPDLHQVRLREDWDGWEQADFAPALESLRQGVSQELNALVVPVNSTAEQRGAVFERLSDESTVRIVGRQRFAAACLKAALAFSEFDEETERTFQLASMARNFGADPAPCLRAEAMALTALGDYEKAHQRWIMLISDYPVTAHEPGDYAEASYTAFENADPRQAMAILTTGLHRFPNDGNFALRAGWVALLTGNAERAYRFLLTGRQIGYPPEKLENAIALLAIAAVQTGAAEDAGVFYQELIDLDPAWENAETIESLEWPEELKSSLRQLVW